MPALHTIRPAHARDIPEVVTLIRELADFEKLPGPDDTAAARLTADYAANRFELLVATPTTPEDPNPASPLLANHNTHPNTHPNITPLVGYALFFMTYSTFRARPSLYLEDLYVTPAHRSHGLGAALLGHLAALAVSRNCCRFEWTVLDWNTRAQSFYRRLGAEILPEWQVCRVTGTALTTLAKATTD